MSRALLVFALLAAGLASAEDVVQTRQSGFKKMGAAMKVIAEQLKSDAPDLVRIASAAQTVSAGAHEQPSWFPSGSGPKPGVETDALPHIWEDTAKFSALSSQLGVESSNFATAVASNDIAAVRTRFKVLADVCSGCHKSFRAD
jgi:cytochrome c556